MNTFALNSGILSLVTAKWTTHTRVVQGSNPHDNLRKLCQLEFPQKNKTLHIYSSSKIALISFMYIYYLDITLG